MHSAIPAEQTTEEADGHPHADGLAALGAEPALRQPEDWLSLLPADALQLIVSLAGPVHSVSASGELTGPLMARTCRALRQACGMDRVVSLTGLRLAHHPNAESGDVSGPREHAVGGPGSGAPGPRIRGSAVAPATLRSVTGPLDAPALCWPELLSRVVGLGPRSVVLEDCNVNAEELRALGQLLPLSVLAILRCHSAGGTLRALLRKSAGGAAVVNGPGRAREAWAGGGGSATTEPLVATPLPPVLHALILTSAADPIPPEQPAALLASLRLLCLCESVVHIDWLSRALPAMHCLRALFLGGCSFIGLPEADGPVRIGGPPAACPPDSLLPGTPRTGASALGGARPGSLRLIEATFCPPQLLQALSDAYPQARLVDFCRGEPGDLSLLVPAVEALVCGGGFSGAASGATGWGAAVGAARGGWAGGGGGDSRGAEVGASARTCSCGPAPAQSSHAGWPASGAQNGTSEDGGAENSPAGSRMLAVAGGARSAALTGAGGNTGGGCSGGNTGCGPPAGLTTAAALAVRAAAQCRMGGRGPTPLHHATLDGRVEVMRGLLQLGASALTKVRAVGERGRGLRRV